MSVRRYAAPVSAGDMPLRAGDWCRWWGPGGSGCKAQEAAGLEPGGLVRVLAPELRISRDVALVQVYGGGQCTVYAGYLLPLGTPTPDIWLDVLHGTPATVQKAERPVAQPEPRQLPGTLPAPTPAQQERWAAYQAAAAERDRRMLAAWRALGWDIPDMPAAPSEALVAEIERIALAAG